MTNGLEVLAQTVVSGNLLLVYGLGLYVLTRYTKNVREAAAAGITVFTGMLVGSVLLWLCHPLFPAPPCPRWDLPAGRFGGRTCGVRPSGSRDIRQWIAP